MAETRVFARAVVGFFLVQSALTLTIGVVATLSVNGFILPPARARLSAFGIVEKETDLIFALLAGALTLLGAALIAASRPTSYRMFKLAMLVSIFLTQIFEFYDIQFWALPDLAFNVIGLTLVNELIAQERRGELPHQSSIDDRRTVGTAGEALP
jgi:hypothetical protein